ncbi:MAG: hypothetical protein K6T86_14810 [Pirellulales bacterium]|nr:hypothetical protein [Pirellulales bacterium]
MSFVFSSNGHMFFAYDRFTGIMRAPRPMREFPTPPELPTRFEQHMRLKRDSPAAGPPLIPFRGGEGTRRYYLDAAIRAVLEKDARCAATGQPKRALLLLATGSGMTFIAVNLLRRIADAGQLRRAGRAASRLRLLAHGSTHG